MIKLRVKLRYFNFKVGFKLQWRCARFGWLTNSKDHKKV